MVCQQIIEPCKIGDNLLTTNMTDTENMTVFSLLLCKVCSVAGMIIVWC